MRRFQNSDWSLTDSGKKRYGLSQKSETKDFSKLSEEEKKQMYNAGVAEGKKAFDDAMSIKDPEEKARKVGEMLKNAYVALGPIADSTYPGYDDSKDPKENAYDVMVCHQFGLKAKSICDPLGLSGNGTEGHTPGTKAIMDKMKKNDERENDIWKGMISEYKQRKNKEKLSTKEFMKLVEKHGGNAEVQRLRKENSKLESGELREQILKDLGLPVTKENLSYIYPFIYYDDFTV